MKRLLFSLSLLIWSTSHACTDFTIQALDGTIINGRSMEFALNLQTRLSIHPQGETVQSSAPNNQKGLAWTSKYGYIAGNVLGMDVAVDGFNEKGLSLGALWFPTAMYATPTTNDNALSTTFVSNWILGNFSTLSEVKQALNNVVIWGEVIQALGGIPPMHLALHDADGNNAVIEFINGEVKWYDNPISVLTNFPGFDWQLTNLQNFISLKALNAAPVNMGQTVLGGTGQGSGLWGIPGDWTPPSRFVRIANFKEFANPANDTKDAVVLAAHLLNTVDIPKGDVVEIAAPQKTVDYTQWIFIKDLTHKVLYFRTYEDLNLHQVDLTKLNLAPGTPIQFIELSFEPNFINVTGSAK